MDIYNRLPIIVGIEPERTVRGPDDWLYSTCTIWDCNVRDIDESFVEGRLLKRSAAAARLEAVLNEPVPEKRRTSTRIRAQQASSRAESQQAFRLLDLPLEIRLMIFRYVAPSGCVMLTMQPFEWPMLVREWDMFDDDHEVVNVKLSVLRVCRQWFRESVQMIISENKLWFGPGEWRGQLQSLPAEFPSWCNTIRMSFDRTEADRQPDQGLNLEYAVDRRIQLEGIGSQFDGTPFGQMCERRRKEVCHDLHEEQIIDLWLHKVNLLAQLEPKHLEFDVTHTWCPARCCRLAKRVFNMFKHAKQGRPDCNSGIVPQVTLVGTYETEEPIIWSLINEAYGFHRDDTRLRRQVPVNNLTGEQREVLEDFEAEIEEQGSDA